MHNVQRKVTACRGGGGGMSDNYSRLVNNPSELIILPGAPWGAPGGSPSGDPQGAPLRGPLGAPRGPLGNQESSGRIIDQPGVLVSREFGLCALGLPVAAVVANMRWSVMVGVAVARAGAGAVHQVGH